MTSISKKLTKGKKQVTATPVDYETVRKFVVYTTDGQTHGVSANRMYNNWKERSASFHGSPGQPHGEVAQFYNVERAEQILEPPKVIPEPVKGVEYYTLEDIRQALKDLNYSETDKITEKVRQRRSLRNDGRYTLEELQTAFKELDSTSGAWYAERAEKAALQARKNRVFKAHHGS